ncbi:MAG: ornithine carbamoyltransferase [Defluviitaleaceae bacterium]|nr:ornithine carbamoyltransferase [Defluviitaleaceae bacterium]MCL2263647.1 ornithine carbamoyltransferase [Defluviitaleaceae bacterium]MCL2263880.1 ornithine carbamoyltransferase [Defluviitaleaceae bacterium]
MKKDLLKMLDLTKDEIVEILNLADQMKYNLKNGIAHEVLKGKTLGMIFQKSSTRTRVSFETGMYQLGGQALFLSSNDLQIGRGEPIEDTARVLARYLDGIMIRTFEQSEVESLAKWASIPVINGLTDFSHPCQILADLMTVREYHSALEGVKMTYIGDGNNMCNSLIVGALTSGMKISVATPKGYEPHADVLKFAEKFGGDFALVNSPEEASANADVMVTDVWASMGQEQEAQKRMKDFAGFQINDKLMAQAHAKAIVLHCLPAHRGEEITAEVFEKHADCIFDEAENRLHAQKAVMALLMGAK